MPRLIMAEVLYGVNVHTGQIVNYGDRTVDEVFAKLQHAGIRIIRFNLSWDRIERQKGQYQFGETDRLVKAANKHGFDLLAVVSGTPSWASANGHDTANPSSSERWKIFLITAVQRYASSISTWQIWNEPDIRKFWTGTPQEYVRLLKTAFHVIKEVDPRLQIVSAGLDGNGEKYLETLLENGAADACDIIAYHLYPPSTRVAELRINGAKALLQKFRVTKPLWITEIGWQTGGWPSGPGVVKNEEVKALMVSSVLPTLEPYADALFWYRAVDVPGMYGLIEYDNGKLRDLPAFAAFRRAARAAGGTER